MIASSIEISTKSSGEKTSLIGTSSEIELQNSEINYTSSDSLEFIALFNTLQAYFYLLTLKIDINCKAIEGFMFVVTNKATIFQSAINFAINGVVTDGKHHIALMQDVNEMEAEISDI